MDHTRDPKHLPGAGLGLHLVESPQVQASLVLGAVNLLSSSSPGTGLVQKRRPLVLFQFQCHLT
jgi:hypothetical protein